jgi:hypothetical protein
MKPRPMLRSSNFDRRSLVVHTVVTVTGASNTHGRLIATSRCPAWAETAAPSEPPRQALAHHPPQLGKQPRNRPYPNGDGHLPRQVPGSGAPLDRAAAPGRGGRAARPTRARTPTATNGRSAGVAASASGSWASWRPGQPGQAAEPTSHAVAANPPKMRSIGLDCGLKAMSPCTIWSELGENFALGR